jgi:hypothetical protein
MLEEFVYINKFSLGNRIYNEICVNAECIKQLFDCIQEIQKKHPIHKNLLNYNQIREDFLNTWNSLNDGVTKLYENRKDELESVTESEIKKMLDDTDSMVKSMLKNLIYEEKEKSGLDFSIPIKIYG